MIPPVDQEPCGKFDLLPIAENVSAARKMRANETARPFSVHYLKIRGVMLTCEKQITF